MINVYSSHRLNQEQDWNPFGRGSTKAELWRFEIGGLDRRAAGREAWSGPFETSAGAAGAAGRCLRLHTFPFDKLFLLHITIYRFLMNDSIFLDSKDGSLDVHIWIYIYRTNMNIYMYNIHSTYNIYNTHIYMIIYV